MKGLLSLFFLLPMQLIAQDISGVWVGILHNDSTDLDLHYEIVISEKKGKLSGFSYTNFIVDGRSFTGVKSLTINKRFGKLYVEDEQLVFNNYNFEPPKGVRQASILELSSTEEMLSGRFTTTCTKQYGRPVTGHIYLLRKPDPDVSKLMEILNGLQLASDLSFIKKEEVPVTPEKQKEKDVVVKKEDPVTTPQVITPPVERSKEKEVVVKKEEPVSTPQVTKPPVEKPKEKEVVVKKEEPVKTTQVIAPPDETPKPIAPPVELKKEEVRSPLQQKLATRKIETVQTIWFTSDSLVLELYDNGYVDDDSVSIVLNGKAFISNIRLSEKASVKTIYITPDMGDSVNLVMLAENLGTIAPNSGLAVIRDGKKEHRVAFSGDLRKNAAIVLRRKKD